MNYIKFKGINKPVSISLVIIISYWLPYVILGENGSFTIHDNLDAIFTTYKILFESGKLFAANTSLVDQMMCGLPRSNFNSEWYLSALFYWILGPLNTYIFEKLIVSVVGFSGMYLLLSKYVLKNNEHTYILFGVALCYAILPYYPYGISVSGIPLVSYAFLNARVRGVKLADFLIFLLFALFSNLILSGFFVLLSFSFLLVFDFATKKKINWGLFLALVLLSLLYIISHYRLFISFLISTEYVSSRVEYNMFKYFSQSVRDVLGVFLEGQYHAAGLQKRVLIPAILVAILFILEKKSALRSWYVILSFIIFNSIVYGFISWHKIAIISAPLKKILPIGLERMSWLNPMLWHLLFALSLTIIYNNLRIGKKLVCFFLAAQLIYCFWNHELFVNRNSPTVREFYAVDQFKKIKRLISEPLDTYRVASLGLHPSISLYNGFYTIDGYSSDYPLDYKHKFRKIIEKELEKSDNLRKYYDSYGARVYLFTGQDIEYSNYKGNNIILKDLEFDTQLMKAMNCKYIISAVKIDVSNHSYKLISKITDSASAWDIYLYAII